MMRLINNIDDLKAGYIYAPQKGTMHFLAVFEPGEGIRGVLFTSCSISDPEHEDHEPQLLDDIEFPVYEVTDKNNFEDLKVKDPRIKELMKTIFAYSWFLTVENLQNMGLLY